MSGSKLARKKRSPRGLAEGLAVLMVAAGIIMMMQPFWLVLFSYSFAVVLTGTVLFMAASKLPE